MTSRTEKSLNNRAYWETQYGEVENDTRIIVTLHWTVGNYATMQGLYKDVDSPLRAIFIQAPYPYETEFSWFPDGDEFYEISEAEQAPGIRQSTGDVAAFLRDLKTEYRAKIAIAGMSQGGDISLSMAVYYPELIDLAIPIAGRLSVPMRPAQFETKAPLPKISMQQGSSDEIVSVESAREVLAWLKSVGFEAELHEYPELGHGLSKEMVSRIQQILRNF